MSEADTTPLPYRPNVGAVLFNPAGEVFVGRRAWSHGRPASVQAWQLPQGGIDEGEAPEVAVLRELYEEVGAANVAILGEHDTWLTYDLPPELVGVAFGGRYRGQRQKWFALRHLGVDADIRLDAHGEPEFDAWRWVPLADLPGLAVPFKRVTYETIASVFARYAVPTDAWLQHCRPDGEKS